MKIKKLLFWFYCFICMKCFRWRSQWTCRIYLFTWHESYKYGRASPPLCSTSSIGLMALGEASVAALQISQIWQQPQQLQQQQQFISWTFFGFPMQNSTAPLSYQLNACWLSSLLSASSCSCAIASCSCNCNWCLQGLNCYLVSFFLADEYQR